MGDRWRWELDSVVNSTIDEEERERERENCEGLILKNESSIVNM